MSYFLSYIFACTVEFLESFEESKKFEVERKQTVEESIVNILSHMSKVRLHKFCKVIIGGFFKLE